MIDDISPAPVDHEWQRVDPRLKAVRRIVAVATGGGLVLIVAVLAWIFEWSRGVTIAALVPAVVLLVLQLLNAELGNRTMRYRFTDRALEIQRGWLVRRRSLLPYHRIQRVDETSGPIMRRFGLVTLQLRTASTQSDGQIPGLDRSAAESVRRDLISRSGADDAV